MTGTEKIIDKILTDAQQAAQAISQAAQAKAEQTKARAMESAKTADQASLEKANAQAAQAARRAVSGAEMDAKKMILSARQDLMQECFDLCIEKILKMPDEKYEKLLTQTALKSIQTGDEQILVNKKDKKRLSGAFINNINAALQQKSIPASVTISDEEASIKCGFILRRGNVEINSSFEAVLESMRDDLESMVANILFDVG